MYGKVKISITNACEGKCSYCYRSARLRPCHLPFEVTEKAIREAAVCGAKLVHISGGNPVLHPRFADTMAAAFSSGLPVKLSGNVGGLSCRRIREYQDRGLTELALSVASLTPRTHNEIRGIAGEFERVISLLQELGNDGPRVVLTFVVTAANAHEISALEDLLGYGPRVCVKVQLPERTLMHDGARAKRHEICPENAIEAFAEALPRESIPAPRAARLIFIPGTHPAPPPTTNMLYRWSQGLFGPDPETQAHCAYMVNNPHIKEDASVNACCGRDPDRVIGTLSDSSLAQIYADHVARYARHRQLPFKSCQYCVFYSYYQAGIRGRFRENQQLL